MSIPDVLSRCTVMRWYASAFDNSCTRSLPGGEVGPMANLNSSFGENGVEGVGCGEEVEEEVLLSAVACVVARVGR